MKKLFLALFVLLFTHLFFAKSVSESLIEDIFEKNSPTYEFDIKNPLFKSSLYIENLNDFKGKILLVRSYNYDLEKNGVKHYGDAGPLSEYKYYVFDSEGFVSEVYQIDFDEEVYSARLYCDKIQYSENQIKDFYSLFYIGANSEIKELEYENTFEYNFGSDDNGFFYKNDSEKISYVNSSGFLSVKKDRVVDDKNQVESEYKYYSDYCVYVYYEDNGGINRSVTYQYGCEIKEERPLPDGYWVKTCSNKPGIQKCSYREVRGSNVKTEEKIMERRFNKDNFLIYEMERPEKNGAPGSYHEMTAEILSSPDKLFLMYCKD